MMNTELITKYDMLPQGCKVLCAVSGGADSMCLLHWLYSQAERLNITVCAAHFEHGLRGERGRGCAVLLSPLPHGLELFSGYDRGIEIRPNIAAVLQNTGHHIFVPGLAGVVGERFLIQLVCQALE